MWLTLDIRDRYANIVGRAPVHDSREFMVFYIGRWHWFRCRGCYDHVHLNEGAPASRGYDTREEAMRDAEAYHLCERNKMLGYYS